MFYQFSCTLFCFLIICLPYVRMQELSSRRMIVKLLDRKFIVVSLKKVDYILAHIKSYWLMYFVHEISLNTVYRLELGSFYIYSAEGQITPKMIRRGDFDVIWALYAASFLKKYSLFDLSLGWAIWIVFHKSAFATRRWTAGKQETDLYYHRNCTF